MATTATSKTVVTSTEQAQPSTKDVLMSVLNTLQGMDARLVELEHAPQDISKGVTVAQPEPAKPIYPEIGSTFDAIGWRFVVTGLTKWIDPVRQGRTVTMYPLEAIGDKEFVAVPDVRMPLALMDSLRTKPATAAAPIKPATAAAVVATDTATVNTAIAPKRGSSVSKSVSLATPPSDAECFAVTCFDYSTETPAIRQYSCFLANGKKVTVQRYKILAENRNGNQDADWRRFAEPMTSKVITVKQAESWYDDHTAVRPNGSALKTWA